MSPSRAPRPMAGSRCWRNGAPRRASCSTSTPRAFTPPPKVTSTPGAVRRPARRRAFRPMRDALERVAAAGFGQRRKMLRQSLKSLGVPPRALLAAAGIDGTGAPRTSRLKASAPSPALSLNSTSGDKPLFRFAVSVAGTNSLFVSTFPITRNQSNRHGRAVVRGHPLLSERRRFDRGLRGSWKDGWPA